MALNIPRPPVSPPPKPSNLIPGAFPEAFNKEADLRHGFKAIWDILRNHGLYLDNLAQVVGFDNRGVAPGEHNQTHTTGADSLAGTSNPSAITLGENAGDPGDPATLFAPMDHEHDDSALAFLAPISEGISDGLGVDVRDDAVRKLLEYVYLELLALFSDLENLSVSVEAGASTVLSAILAASVNDYSPGTASIWRLESTSAVSITGIAGAADGTLLKIVNVGSDDITLSHQSSSSSSGNRILCSGYADIVLSADLGADLWYDATTERWRAYAL